MPTRANGRKREYCSVRCRDSAAWRRRHPELPARDCDHCGTSFVPRQRNQRFCCRACTRKADQVLRKGGWGPYAFRLLFVLERGGRCEECGVPGGRELEVHHIRPIIEGGEVCDPANVKVLCRACHRRVPPASRRSPDPPVDSEASCEPSPALESRPGGNPLSRAEMFARATQRR